MSEKQPFYLCKHCGNIVEMIHNSGAKIVCCGDEMIPLVPNTTEAAIEKHLPVVSVSGNIVLVEVGSTPHPMLDNHYIQWIYLKTSSGMQRKDLKPGDAPKATFTLNGDKPLAAYAYCNLHGLWKTDI